MQHIDINDGGTFNNISTVNFEQIPYTRWYALPGWPVHHRASTKRTLRFLGAGLEHAL